MLPSSLIQIKFRSCPTYNNLPTGCYLMKKAGECCKVVECDSGTFVSSTTNLNSLANGGGIYIKNPNGGSQFVTPTMPSGGTPAPGSGGTGNKAPTLSMCSRSLFKIKAFNFLHFGPLKSHHCPNYVSFYFNRIC